MSTDPLADLSEAGVAVWLDDLSRGRLRSGNLAELVARRHVVGVTTNPTIFAKALGSGSGYEEQVRDLALRGVAVGEAVRLLIAADVRDACDILRPVHERSGGRSDGRVSIEVDPRLAHDTDRTVAEARGLWWLVDRPNLYVKIPATPAGLPAIATCLAEGISVNVTLIFSLERYAAVIDAFLAGLEGRVAEGGSLDGLASVASFFVSRVDAEVDRRLDAVAEDADYPGAAEAARRLRGRAAIANARLAYETYEGMLASPRWRELAGRGARPQRPLWASTGVKDPAYADTRYVVELVAPDTVNTMPELTLKATADHGRVRGDTVRATYDESRATLNGLRQLGVDIDDVTALLESQGIAAFEKSWDELIASVVEQMERAGATVAPSGAAKPAGGETGKGTGPAAAAPRASPQEGAHA
jgi:transaldolase